MPSSLGVISASALAIALLVPLGASSAAPVAEGDPSSAAAAQQPAEKVPDLRVRRQVTGLSNPWDVQPIGRGRLLITERDSARLLFWEDGVTRQVRFPSQDVWVSGETGLMSIALGTAFSNTRNFYTCQGGTRDDGSHDVRVMGWRLSVDGTRAGARRTLLAGLPATSGRHGGCRLLLVGNRQLFVGTGDAAVGTNPRDKRSLGGKTLRLNAKTGDPWPTNPWADANSRNKRYVYTYGHRNVQGLAERKDGSLWSVEHGSFRDDEVNKLRKGGDYGWHPVPEGGGPGYNEQVPMTDHTLPGKQRGARWRSGEPTIATSGAAWVRGKKWGGLRGTLAVAALAGNRVVFMKFDDAGRLRWTRTPDRLRDDFGRMRSVSVAPNRDLLITTSNGSDDAVLRVSPR